MHIFSVSEFIDHLNSILDEEEVIIEGEVNGFSISQNKWVFFSLKDEDGVVECFSMVFRLKMPIEDGMQVRVVGKPKLYGKSGRFRIVVDEVEPIGLGALQRAFELLKNKLDKEGLFAPERKRELPRFPSSIGLITSRDSAAFTDFLKILDNRWGGIDIFLAHVRLQGAEAVKDIVGAFNYFNSLKHKPEVIVLTRGGGSLEDLQTFNTEEVVRAVFSSSVPVISGVGHERDVSIADLVADVRAATPSNAAELIVPHKREILGDIQRGLIMMDSRLDHNMQTSKQKVKQAISTTTVYVMQRVNEAKTVMNKLQSAFSQFRLRLQARQKDIQISAKNLVNKIDLHFERLQTRLKTDNRILKSLDPTAILKRGYSIIYHQGKILRTVDDIAIGDPLTVQLHKGSIETKVTKKQKVKEIKKQLHINFNE